MLKKTIAVVMSIALAASLAGCGGKQAADAAPVKTDAPAGEGKGGAPEGEKGGLAGDGKDAASGDEKGPAAGSGEEKVVLTYAEVNPENSLDGQIGAFFKQKTEELSNGTVVINIQASGVMGAENDVLDNMTAGGGTVDMARISCFALNNYGGKLSALLSVPYTFNNREHYWKFTESELGQKVLEEPTQLGLGIKGLFFMEEGFRDFFFRDTISGIGDLKNKKIRVSSDPILTGVVEALGASPTVVSFTELYSSLQSGVVDGADQPIALYQSNAFNEVAPCLIEDGHTLSASEVIVTENAWNKLSESQKEAVQEAGKAASEYCRELSEQLENQSKEELEKAGVTFVEVADKQPWQEACKDIIAEYTKGYEAEYQQILDFGK